jgi:release factor glutamine methyltransferase
MTISEALALTSLLTSDSAKLDIEVLLMAALQCERSYLYTWPEKNLTQVQLQQFHEWIKRRQTGEPVAHILGRRGFWTLDLEVSPVTLIPRPDTEILVEAALEFIAHMQKPKILDLGTGTGAIALAIAKERPDAQITATDFSAEILALAERNRNKHHIHNVKFLLSHWWGNITEKYDLIISNPPYIDEQDIHLNQGDVRFEPATALIAKNNGLADIIHIVEFAPNYLNQNGGLMLEHGWQQGESVRNIFASNDFGKIATIKDYGGQDRVTVGWV